MFERILIICAGNICRSPFAEVLMKQLLPQKKISSAGLVTAKSGLQGKTASKPAQSLAETLGYTLVDHKARQATVDMFHKADLILVMEQKHKKIIQEMAPEIRGKVLLISHWSGQSDILDPFKKGDLAYRDSFAKITKSVKTWFEKLS